MYPLQLHFSPGSPHVPPASPKGSPAARPSRSAQGILPPKAEELPPQGEPAAVMAAAGDAEEAGNAALVLAADRQSLQLQVVKTAEEAAQVGIPRLGSGCGQPNDLGSQQVQPIFRNRGGSGGRGGEVVASRWSSVMAVPEQGLKAHGMELDLQASFVAVVRAWLVVAAGDFGGAF